MREAGVSARTVIRMLDDPAWPETLAAVRATIADEDA